MTNRFGNARMITRREMLRLTALTGVGLVAAQCVPPTQAPAEAPALTEAPKAVEATEAPTAAPAATGAAGKLVWVSPRGTLEVMDDFNLWVAIEMGYFKEMNVEVQVEPGPLEALAVTKLVAEKQADIGYPSPGVFMASLDAGMPVVMAWEMMMDQVFDFALPKDSPITSVKELEGKTIALGSEGWSVIVDPILVEAGVDPKSVQYLNAGNQWGQAVSLGQADAGLSWRGLAAQWLAQGLELKYLVGKEFSNHPANGYCIRKEDLDDEARVDLLTRFFKANCMAFEFSRANPQAAAQITYAQFPALREQMTPQLALDSMLELGTGYFEGERIGKGYGYLDLESWQSYIDTVYELGQIKNQYKAGDVVTNFFIEEANKFDREKARADAAAFELDDEFKGLEIKYEV
jgi:NitT/TauT family transport system substrate-binding protein